MKYLLAGVFTVLLAFVILAVVIYTVRTIYRAIRQSRARWEVKCVEGVGTTRVWLVKGELKEFVGEYYHSAPSYEDRMLYAQAEAEQIAASRNSLNKILSW